MTQPPKFTRDGPVEEFPFPDTLTGHVTTSGAGPRIHGYDVASDLARHYAFAEIALLTLKGEAPAADEGQAFAQAAALLAPVPITHAPAHAAVLARLCGATPAATIGVGAIALGEEAGYVIAAHRAWLHWLRDPNRGEPPPRVSSSSTGVDEASAATLRSLLPPSFSTDASIVAARTLREAALAVFVRVGLADDERLHAAWVWARLPAVMAEGFAARPGDFRTYPMDLPPFRYEAPRHEP